jgi:uncharacterized membrane protein
MDNLGYYHPMVVHFALGLLVAGVLLRLLSLSGRFAFAGPAALVLVLAGTLSAVGAAFTGTAAHGPVERVPGAAEAVTDHEEWGEWARDAFLVMAALEIGALVARRFGREKQALMAAAAVGIVGLGCLLYTGLLGGRLVYSYAGGVGIRSGDPADVDRLLVAAIYHRSQADRKAGRGGDAARLLEEAVRRYPGDLGIQLLVAESKLLDLKDPGAAVELLSHLSVPKDERRLRTRHAFLLADALEAAGQKDAARAALQTLASDYPDNPRVKKRLEALGK